MPSFERLCLKSISPPRAFMQRPAPIPAVVPETDIAPARLHAASSPNIPAVVPKIERHGSAFLSLGTAAV
ncbi:hypothetical protein B0H15DRAFT_945950 [Mycena belliarum]|uniref:Uncharacterized protein n=1 Tax=Mycena belliarum TaxID=1033014 RepID=A0AAD6UCM2_9AGAR|nr:hypothetical protein B0H15DRAFT_945950 [Mycena belliae]